MGPATNWGKKADEHREVEQAAGGFDVSAVDVEGIRHTVERVEGDAHREQDSQHRRGQVDAEVAEEVGAVAGEEVEVLEEPEDPEVHHQADGEDPLAALSVLGDLQQPADGVVGQRGHHQQPEEPPVEGSVEHVGGDQQQHVLGPPGQQPVENQDEGQEGGVLQRVEGHGPLPRPSPPPGGSAGRGSSEKWTVPAPFRCTGSANSLIGHTPGTARRAPPAWAMEPKLASARW